MGKRISAEASRERDAEMLRMYENGSTLAEIGEKFEVSRQAVQKKFGRMGITSAGKGVKARKVVKEQAVEAAKKQRVKETWDMTTDEYATHVAKFGNSSDAGSPMYGYMHQRKKAKTRGIAWNFTFKTWWKLWEESGKWDERGHGQYGMGRVGNPSTPFGPSTCKVATISEIIAGDFFERKHTGKGKSA
jgi:predicted DNA-binding protein YlxM (UPF0122 family)